MSAIPKVFHRVWLGGRPMPELFVRWGRTWTDLHPGWEMRTWTEAELPPLRNAAFMDRATCLGQRADLARYEIMLREGGVYVDTDMECLRNIEPLIVCSSLVVTWISDMLTRYSSAIFGCAPGHPALELVVAGVPAAWATEPWATMGPPHFTAGVKVYQAALPVAVRVLPRRTFQPFTYEQYGLEPYTHVNYAGNMRPFHAAELPPETYGVNHHSSKWFAPTKARLSP